MKPTLWQRLHEQPMLTSTIAFAVGALAAMSVPSSYAYERMRLAEEGQAPPATEQPPQMEPQRTDKPGDMPGDRGEGRDHGSEKPPGGPGESGNQGPSDEEMNKKQEEDEKRQKEMEAKQLERMKRGLKQIEKMLERTRQSYDRYAKKGVTVPAECSDALGAAEKILETLKAATTMEEMQNGGMDDLQERFDTLNQCRQQLEQLARLPQILKKLDREIARLERTWTRAKAKAPEDAADAVADGDKFLQGIKDARAKLDDLAKSGNVEDIQAVMEDDIYGRFDDIQSVLQRLEAAANAKKFLTQAPRMFKELERIIAKKKKAGDDVSQLVDLLARMKSKLEEIKSLKAGTEEFQDAIDDLAELGQSFHEAAGMTDESGGGNLFPAQASGPALTLPQGFGGTSQRP